ncbi:hypothetical protein ACSEOG_02700 [Pseudomonas paraeruginosa]
MANLLSVLVVLAMTCFLYLRGPQGPAVGGGDGPAAAGGQQRQEDHRVDRVVLRGAEAVRRTAEMDADMDEHGDLGKEDTEPHRVR